MKSIEFLNLLSEHPNRELLFEYQKGSYVAANYHITEVKNTQIKSVDCGGRSDAWNETIIQLWESPKEIGKTEYMRSDKALSILNRVDHIHAVDKNARVLFEYSNDQFHKANLEIHNVELTSDKVIIQLFVPQTDCKAKVLDTTPREEACCSGPACC